MRLVSRIRRGVSLMATGRDPDDPRYWSGDDVAWVSASGQVVTTMTALQVPALFAAVNKIAKSLAALPAPVYRSRGDEGRERQDAHPVARILNRRANPWQDAYTYRLFAWYSLLLRGNHYAEIRLAGNGRVGELWPWHPDLVRVEQLASGRLRYLVSETDGRERVVAQDLMFHVRGPSTDGVVGMDPLTSFAREAIGSAQAARDYAARFYRNDARPSLAVLLPAPFRDAEQAKEYRKRLVQAQTGENRHKPLVLDGNPTIETFGLTAEQAQVLESRSFDAHEIARLYDIPPHKIGLMDRATFTNIEHQGIEFVVDTLTPWARAWEIASDNQLLTRPDLFVKHNLNALMRGDVATRTRAYAVGRQWGWLSANDVRRFEDMNPIGPEGDIYLQPVNMVDAADPQAGEPEDRAPDAPEPAPQPSGFRALPAAGGDGLVDQLLGAACERVARKEVSIVRRVAERAGDDRGDFVGQLTGALVEHADWIRQATGASRAVAEAHIQDLGDALNACAPIGEADLETVLTTWPHDGAERLAARIKGEMSDATA